MMTTVEGNEIVNIGIGQSGVHMLNEFYCTIMNEHKIDKDGRFIGKCIDTNDQSLILKRNVYFSANGESDAKYIPRAIFLDSDKCSINKIKSSYLGSLLPSDHLFGGTYSEPMLIWPKGHTEGSKYIDQYMDILRRAIESCDYIQGFQLHQSITGGFGSGLGTLLLKGIHDNYPKSMTSTWSIYPAISSADYATKHNYIFEIYNSILSINQLQMHDNDTSFILNNSKLFNIAQSKCGLEYPTYDDLNYLISQVMSGVTSTLRFHSEPSINSTMKAIHHAFCPWRLSHFLGLSHSPFLPRHCDSKTNQNASRIIGDILYNNDVSGMNKEDGIILHAAIIYRGNKSNTDAMAKISGSPGIAWKCSPSPYHDDNFHNTCPRILPAAYVYDGNNHCYDKYAPVIGTAIISSIAIKGILNRLRYNFAKIFKKRAYLHWYIQQGMDEMEFLEADRNISNLAGYIRTADKVVDLDDSDDLEEDESDEEEF